MFFKIVTKLALESIPLNIKKKKCIITVCVRAFTPVLSSEDQTQNVRLT